MLESVTRRLLNKSVIGAVGLTMIGMSSAAQADVELTFFYPVAVGGPVTKVVDGYAETYSEMTPGVTVTPVYTGSYLDTVTKTITAVKGGNPPDIVGPMGVRSAATFFGGWLDIAPYIESNNYDLSDFDSAFVDFWNIGGEQIGLPFGAFPSMT